MNKEDQYRFMELEATIVELAEKVQRLEMDVAMLLADRANVLAFEPIEEFAKRHNITITAPALH